MISRLVINSTFAIERESLGLLELLVMDSMVICCTIYNHLLGLSLIVAKKTIASGYATHVYSNISPERDETVNDTNQDTGLILIQRISHMSISNTQKQTPKMGRTIPYEFIHTTINKSREQWTSEFS
jgi:hypothetical protein